MNRITSQGLQQGEAARIQRDPAEDGPAEGGRVVEKGQQRDAEDLLEHKAEPEDRHRDAEIRKRRHRVVHDRILTDRRDHADQNRDDEREAQGRDEQLYRGGEAAEDLAGYRLVVRDGDTKITMQEAHQPPDILNIERLIQAVFRLDRLYFGRRHARRLEDALRPTGDRMDKQEQ